MSNAPQEGAIGVKITITILGPTGTPLDISLASVKNFIFEKPDGQLVTKPAVFETNGTDGKLSYITTAADDLSPHGSFKVQPDIVLPPFTGRGAVSNFIVNKNIP